MLVVSVTVSQERVHVWPHGRAKHAIARVAQMTALAVATAQAWAYVDAAILSGAKTAAV